MYYTRQVEDGVAPDLPSYDARNILRELNYFPFINRRHIDTMKEAMSEPQWVELFSDMSAAAITQFHDRQMIDLDQVWGVVSRFFHQAIQMRGFSPVPNPDGALAFSKSESVEILVAGT
ncbi:MAG: hypothetical protein HQL32_07095 [Planctomycetes bacterium]|nr:hypothetical protein [Planctomycetota bacterium]